MQLTEEQIEKVALDFVKKPGMKGYIEPGDLIDFARDLLAAHNAGTQGAVGTGSLAFDYAHKLVREKLGAHPQPITAAARDVHALRVARAEIGLTISDPMWADHAEVSKRALKRWHEAIDVEINRLDRAKGE